MRLPCEKIITFVSKRNNLYFCSALRKQKPRSGDCGQMRDILVKTFIRRFLLVFRTSQLHESLSRGRQR